MMFTLNFNISINSLEFQYFLIINYMIKKHDYLSSNKHCDYLLELVMFIGGKECFWAWDKKMPCSVTC